jgi:hypothetical protein
MRTELAGALGRIRTCNLLIRSPKFTQSGHGYQRQHRLYFVTPRLVRPCLTLVIGQFFGQLIIVDGM